MILQCVRCRDSFNTTITRSTKYCNKKCYGLANRGKNNHNWKGGKYLSIYGYTHVRAPKEHPFKQANGYIMEHRLVMEKHLERYLKPTEPVHHINGIKTDNRIENLVVITKRQHNAIHLNSPTKICLIPICNDKFVAKGFCDRHYRQYRRKALPKKYYKYFTSIKNYSR